MNTPITRRHALAAFGAIALLSSTSIEALSAVDPVAAKYVAGIGKDVLALANGGSKGVDLRNKFASLLNQTVNLQGISASALGTYRSKLPAQDKDKFRQLVSTYAAALFVWYVDKFRGSDFVVDNTVTDGKFIKVRSKIVKSTVTGEEVVWWLLPKGSGYQVVDLSVLGVRLSISMRDAFSRVLKKSNGDFNALYAFLAEAETW
jgi:ABC-type transporter MlaC component